VWLDVIDGGEVDFEREDRLKTSCGLVCEAVKLNLQMAV
jgi:hypothetical protein